ncbi:hypothetical protein A1O3_05245 [Capronia epimyces CBS 606.96]|uniref:Transcription factor domain-containing protein n=1 Tax=Capronia epimyces CBS 606.96 TaxID=1182542 RepID=W9Y4K3_9EURO|nr:uncharacterized protein A1O3_05245 [Capronia epimyces CBS 606.96]EXJ84575.1 hypothetical protein A1O3_05245 [Capronia epimyces CBS 606.96]
MAMESPLLLDAITAWSSTHLSLQDKSYETAAIAHRSTALNSLMTSLGSSNRDPEMELASCLIHCSLESISGDTEQWFRHHVGAYEMIRSMAATGATADLDLRRFSTTFEGRWLLRSFAYHDIMMAVAEGRKPLLVSGEYWADMGNVGADTYFGLASRIMFLISEISILDVDMANPAAAEEGLDGSFSASAFRIEQALISWTCGLSDNEQLVNLAEMYRSAALIYIYRTLRQHRPEYTHVVVKKIERQVVDIVQRVQSMPARCLAESSLLFPMFMAGGEAEDPGHVQVIRHRMLDIINERHFHNMEVVLKVLEEVWHLRATGVSSPGGRKIDWKDVLARRRWMLSIT